MNTDFGSIHPSSLTAVPPPVTDASTSSQARLDRLSDLPTDIIEKIVSVSGKTDRIALALSMPLGRVTIKSVSSFEQARLKEEIQPFIDEIISKLNYRADSPEIEHLINIFKQERTPILDQKTRITILKNSIVNVLFSTDFGRMSLSQLVTAFKRFPPLFNGLFETLVAKEEERKKIGPALRFASVKLQNNREIVMLAIMYRVPAHLRDDAGLAGAGDVL